MKRFIPHPLLAFSLLLMWLLLNQSVSPGQIVLGGAVALLASGAMTALKPEKVQLRSVRPIPRLLASVIVDIVRSNIAVARIVLFPAQKDRVSGFVRMPIDLRNQYGVAVLACIITATPGTMWVQFDRKSNSLLVHVLDLIDEQEWIALIKRRYEALLMEIFE
ncbi:Na+/H+ antiporter subunit E [Allosphingosinicella vermicomposti]|uniref:Na+/H+ antiporter subunit E n=1 Tax=Allosphingosinicella vermicomposti TaxID=614671 RepID=UPI000D0F8D4E|nr:Na+/H+ antiporter subunit E [Allosphingosinicella vermicomposti]